MVARQLVFYKYGSINTKPPFDYSCAARKYDSVR
jgi:hypothetical protein